MKLSICIVTMNRALQLQEALESCLKCKLPTDTEFVIIDNASIDETEDIVKSALKGYNHIYIKMDRNLGCGGGRNFAFEKSNGEYVYVLDDDALIDQPDFFDVAIKTLDTYPNIVSLTSQIYDNAWACNRLSESGKEFAPGLFFCKMFCGGSHFLRKSFFSKPPYLSNIYGYEELLPSLMIWDAKKINAFLPTIKIIHNPEKNKWDRRDLNNTSLVINECAIQCGIKLQMYPFVFHPLVMLAFNKRCNRHLLNVSDGKAKAKKKVKESILLYPINNRIKTSTVIDLFKLFGFSVF